MVEVCNWDVDIEEQPRHKHNLEQSGIPVQNDQNWIIYIRVIPDHTQTFE